MIDTSTQYRFEPFEILVSKRIYQDPPITWLRGEQVPLPFTLKELNHAS